MHKSRHKKEPQIANKGKLMTPLMSLIAAGQWEKADDICVSLLLRMRI